ncbi:hypothetical protein [Pseudomonas guariconensis]|uniref:hypothetical protein n=1 Tax=Pseudomonas guariconensis TaxID=1288410 RepID=UPI003906D34D
MSDNQELPIPHFELKVSDRLNKAAQLLVHNKYLLDRVAKHQGGKMLAGDLFDSGYWPHQPLAFLAKILPFFHTCKTIDDSTAADQPAAVPTANTLGCSWSWSRCYLDQAEIERRHDELSDFGALERGTLNTASYHWVRPLGLIAPAEGKNRVDFFREHGTPTIPALIRERTYADADRIVIYTVKQSGFTGTWAVLDNRWVEVVHYPHWTLPLMEAYGAKSAVWPSNFPEPETVHRAFFQHSGTTFPLGHPDWGRHPVVDLATIEAIREFRNEPVRATVFELNDDIKIDHRILLITALIALVAGVVMGILPEAWMEARIFAGMVLGAAVMAGMMPYMIPFVRTRRKFLDKGSFLPGDKAPKNGGRTTTRHLG